MQQGIGAKSYRYPVKMQVSCCRSDRVLNFAAPSSAEAGTGGSQVEDAIAAGRHEDVCHYCQGDVILLLLVFLRFHLVVGELSPTAHAASVASLGEAVRSLAGANVHLAEFAELAASLPVGGGS